jgi:cell wall-associated NlpC family hydrolase
LARVARRVFAAFALITCVAVAGAVAWNHDGSATKKPSVNGAAVNGIRDSEAAQSFPEPASSNSHSLAKSPEEAAATAAASSAGDSADAGVSPGAPSDAEVRRDLQRLKRYQRRARSGGLSESGPHALARAPFGAPARIADAVAGGNAIATFPYRLGGGHDLFVDNAYDCSGSVSYALAAAGLVGVPLSSGEFMKWGVPGRGRWLTVYANPGHVFMTVGALRFDTSGRAGPRGSRWQIMPRSARGFVARHWRGL